MLTSHALFSTRAAWWLLQHERRLLERRCAFRYAGANWPGACLRPLLVPTFPVVLRADALCGARLRGRFLRLPPHPTPPNAPRFVAFTLYHPPFLLTSPRDSPVSPSLRTGD